MRRAILLINTGSPLSPSVRDVRRYLREFLTDPLVMPLPGVLRSLLVNGIIAPMRAPASAGKYATLFTDAGVSLLVEHTQRLAERMQSLSASDTPIYVAMRYGGYHIRESYRRAVADGVSELLVIPLFPHWAESSFWSAQQYAEQIYLEEHPSFELHFVKPFYDHPSYIDAFAEQIGQVVRRGDLVLTSYHGIPISSNRPYEGDTKRDYCFQTEETTRLLSVHPLFQGLDLTFQVCYQSRFGGGKWTTPNTKDLLSYYRSNGLKRIVIACPGFLCDNLETVYEIGVEGRELYSTKGQELVLVPCPNSSISIARALLELIY